MMTTKKATAVAGIDGDDTQMNDITPATTPTTATKKEGKEESRRRFEVELEFVQCLASPSYLNFLAQNEYFDSPDFIAYLKYLQYWRIPPYATFVVFPHALYFLQLLQDNAFREAIKRDDFALMVHQQQGWNWQFEKTFKQRPPPETANPNTPQQQFTDQTK